MKKAIIFGISGQDGFYLSRLLAKQNIEVVGVARNVESIKDGLRGDVSDRKFVDNLISTTLPEYVFHLAADSIVTHEALFNNQASIHTGTLNILEAVKDHCPNAKVFLSGSAIQFENNGKPISEKTPFEITCQYSLARVQSVLSARFFRKKFNIPVYIGYFFHHDSPRRSSRHINQKIVNFVNNLQNDKTSKLTLGDISVEKEFNHAEDVMSGVWTLVNQENEYEAIIGCGEAHTIKEWIEYCFGKVGQNWEDFVSQDSGYTSPFKKLVSDPSLLKSMGWKPQYSFTDLADAMLRGVDD